MKKLSLLICLVTYAIQSFCLESPFPSTVDGITIPNAHVIHNGRILRGQAPILGTDHIDQMVNYGIDEVIIYKNVVKDEQSVSDEILLLQEKGYTKDRIHHIEMPWKNFVNQLVPCGYTIEALKRINSAYQNGKTTFFHCTVGEDRTGMLAGLVRMLFQGWTVEEAFQNEMCLNGYEAGNGNKPAQVISDIRSNLTPLFLKLAEMIERGEITTQNISAEVCSGIDSLVLKRVPENYKCKLSPRYPQKPNKRKI